MKERRKFKRKLFCVPVIVKDDEKGTFYVDYTSDISEGGMLIHTTRLRKPGERVKISFRFPDSIHWIDVECEVVWASKQDDVVPGMGLRFVDLKDDDRKYIRKYMEKEGKPIIEDDESII